MLGLPVFARSKFLSSRALSVGLVLAGAARSPYIMGSRSSFSQNLLANQGEPFCVIQVVCVARSISKLILLSQDLLSQGTITITGYNFDLVLSESEVFGGKGVVASRPPG